METILLKCGYCGAAIDLDEVSLESRICKCKYCKKTVLIPKDRGQVKNWYNRAEELRAACEFDRAIDVYEKILTEDNTDPQAHWGMALSKCGIEFVLDGKTGEYLPTCHRTTEQTILGEPEYQAALEHAEASQRAVIEAEAQKIHEIQKKILSISKQEQPYDVFISYKEEDEQKNRTKDSVLAQQIYDELKKKNYRVFYARKTLEGKLGSEYEPIIYAALSSAKVMVVVGTKPEHFKATWVRNEWRRFQLMGKDGGKTIIPAYRDMYPDELPPELSALTALDMAKIGFMQELTDGISRCMSGRTSAPAASSADADRLNQNAELYLKKFRNFEAAETEYEKLTERYAGDYRGWWGRIICKTKEFTDPAADSAELLEWYTYAMKVAPQNQTAAMEQKFVEYLKLLSGEAALKEMRTVNQMITEYEGQKQDKIAQIGAKQNYISEIASKSNGVVSAKDNMISGQNGELEKTRKKLATRVSRTKAGLIGLGIGAVLLLIGLGGAGAVTVIGMLVICAAAYFGFWAGNLPGKDELTKRIYELEQKIKVLNSEKAKEISIAQTKIQSEKSEEENLRSERDAIEKRIEKCKAFLEIGKDRIAALCLADQCKRIGVEQARSEEDQKLREAAFTGSTGSASQTEETVTFNCPACGNPITDLRSKLLAAGAVICKRCGSRVEIKG